jgi:hypothetical protein
MRPIKTKETIEYFPYTKVSKEQWEDMAANNKAYWKESVSMMSRRDRVKRLVWQSIKITLIIIGVLLLYIFFYGLFGLASGEL